MELKELCRQLSSRIESLKGQLETEEATKNAFIMPFIQMLGYDVFNPLEVVPEMDCDLVKKKGEKIDYAIMRDSKPIMLIECKHWEQNLNLHDTQLQRYFVASNARFGVLTNGIEYRFYTDLDKANIMDERPFLVVDMQNLSDVDIEQLKKFHKTSYDENGILSTAQELKHTTDVKAILSKEIDSPTPEFVRFIAKQAYSGQVNQNVIASFTPIVKKSFEEIVNDKITDRLNMAIKSTESRETKQTAEPAATKGEQLPSGIVHEDKGRGIVTTQEEFNAYLIVKAIVCEILPPERVAYRDAMSRFSVFADDNNRKPICRLYLDGKKKWLVIPDANRKKIGYGIESIEDIYKYAAQLKVAAKLYV